MRKQLPYHLGIAIPCTIIIINGVSCFWSTIFYDSDFTRNFFLVAYATVWITYALAIFTKPGYTDGRKIDGALYIKCLKCNLPKPERAHHCQICGRCVLRMDHHCPWTENCVGFNNMPHFVRFLTVAAGLSGYSCWRSMKFLLYIASNRRYITRILPNYKRLWLAGISLVGNFLIFLTLSILWIRVMIDTTQGQTQIENWEKERVRVLSRKKLAAFVDYPFDIGLMTNLVSALGSPSGWILPWSTPDGDGHRYRKLFSSERWPPAEPLDVHNHEYYRADRWVSYDGENLTDFGVDKADFEVSQVGNHDEEFSGTQTISVREHGDINNHIPSSSFTYKRN